MSKISSIFGCPGCPLVDRIAILAWVRDHFELTRARRDMKAAILNWSVG